MSKSPPPEAERIRRPTPESGSFLRLSRSGSSPGGEAEGQVSHGLNGTHRTAPRAASRVTLRVNRPHGRPTVGGVNRRILTLVVALVPIVVFGVLLSVVTVPFVALGPGPTFDTLGEVDGKQVVDIEGTDVHPTSGHLNMTTVSPERRPDPGPGAGAVDVGPRAAGARAIWSTRRTSRKDEIDKANTTDFKQSEDSAEYAALGYLKYPQAVTVADASPTRARRRASCRTATPSTWSTTSRWPTSRSSPRC